MADEFESFIGKVSGFEDALREEFEVIESDADIDTVRSLIEKKIAKALPGFVDDLILIARTGDTDSSRLKAIAFAFTWYFKESKSADDPFSKLIGELTAAEPTTPKPRKVSPPDLNAHLRPPTNNEAEPTEGGTPNGV